MDEFWESLGQFGRVWVSLEEFEKDFRKFWEGLGEFLRVWESFG